MKRKLISICLIAVIIVPVLTTYGWLQYKKTVLRHEIKHQLMAGMDREALVLIQMTKQQASDLLEWEHAGEFEYKGEMYDVVETEYRGDSVYYWCWWDHEETHLNQQLLALVKNAFADDPLQKEKQNKLYRYFKSLYCEKAPIGKIERIAVFITHQKPFQISAYSLYIPPSTPPPIAC